MPLLYVGLEKGTFCKAGVKQGIQSHEPEGRDPMRQHGACASHCTFCA